LMLGLAVCKRAGLCVPKLAAAESRGTVTKDVSGPKASQRELIARDCAVEEAARDRTTLPATAKPPRTAVDGALIKATTGGEFSEGMNKRLTFDISGLPEAGPLDGRVRPHCQYRRCSGFFGGVAHSVAC
jgi:hypothetical protein